MPAKSGGWARTSAREGAGGTRVWEQQEQVLRLQERQTKEGSCAGKEREIASWQEEESPKQQEWGPGGRVCVPEG